MQNVNNEIEEVALFDFGYFSMNFNQLIDKAASLSYTNQVID